MPAVWWSLSWVISSVCPDNSLILLLEVIKPLPSTSSKLLHIPSLWLSRRRGKSDMLVCGCMWKATAEVLSVVFNAKCFWALDTALNCRRQITLDLEDRLELGKEEPSQVFILDSHKHTQIWSSAVCQCGIISICPLEWPPCPHTTCCHHSKECYAQQHDHPASISGAAAAQSRRPSPPADPQTCPHSHPLCKDSAGLSLNRIPTSGWTTQTEERWES